MKPINMIGTVSAVICMLSAGANAQTVDLPVIDASPTLGVLTPAPTAPAYNPNPDFCINTLAGFQTDNPEARYQFYSLTQEIARDVTPEFRAALSYYGEGDIPEGSNILDVIEDATNPVIRQAAPEFTVANLTYVIDFAAQCDGALSGQINSLRAFDSALANVEFNAVISEDALFIRQILSDSLSRLDADTDPQFGPAAQQYAQALVRTRDAAEFASYVSEVDELEAIFMTDLDGRLKRSNDVINEEMDREVMSGAIGLSNSMNDAAARRAKEERILSLIRIMGGRL